MTLQQKIEEEIENHNALVVKVDETRQQLAISIGKIQAYQTLLAEEVAESNGSAALPA